MTKRDVKYKVIGVCDYCLLEGKNTNWDMVENSFCDIMAEVNVDQDEYKILRDVVDFLLDSIERGRLLGEDEKTIVFRMLLVSDIYRIVQKWDVLVIK